MWSRRVILLVTFAALLLLGASASPGSATLPDPDEGCPTMDPWNRAPIALFAMRGELTVPRGASVELPVCVARATGIDAAIRVSALSLPEGVDVPNAMLHRHETRTVLLVSASRTAEIGEPFLAVIAGDTVGGTRVTAGFLVRVTASPDHGSHEYRAGEDRRMEVVRAP